jgi:predicted nucleotidyltransferase
MADGNWRDYLCGRREVSLKKYLYVFRPLLACRWIERIGSPVPMRFADLVEGVLCETVVRDALDDLVARKKSGDELAVAPPVEVLSDFIYRELARLESLADPEESVGDVEVLNGFFRQYALAV